MQELRRHIRPPNSQPLMFRRLIPNNSILIHQIPIRIMLNHKLGRIPPTPHVSNRPRHIAPTASQPQNRQNSPIIKNLTPQNMPSNPPNIPIPLLSQPLVPQRLRIKIMHLKRAMMHMRLRNTTIRRQRTQKDSMVINQILSPIQMRKHRDFLPRPIRLLNIKHVRGHNIEVLRVPFL